MGKKNMKFKRYLDWSCEREDEGDMSIRGLYQEPWKRSLPRTNKLYVVLPDTRAQADGLVRVIDEDGEDYLYPADWFVKLDVPRALQQSLRTPGPVTKLRWSPQAVRDLEAIRDYIAADSPYWERT